MAQSDSLDLLLELRILIASLGEKDRFGWWPSSFLSSTGVKFLSYAFPKAPFMAAASGAFEAARIAHDERIGIRDVSHLFRLPYEVELRLFERLRSLDGSMLKKCQEMIASRGGAMDRLRSIAAPGASPGAKPGAAPTEGPVSLGEGSPETDAAVCRRFASVYLAAFENSSKAYPYLLGAS